MPLKPGEIRTVWDENQERTVVMRERDGIEYILTVSTNGRVRFREYEWWKKYHLYDFHTTEYRVFDDKWKHQACAAIRAEASLLRATIRSQRLSGQRFP
jgi:hypothetical protein